VIHQRAWTAGILGRRHRTALGVGVLMSLIRDVPGATLSGRDSALAPLATKLLRGPSLWERRQPTEFPNHLDQLTQLFRNIPRKTDGLLELSKPHV
jgi:hypothetical protein